MMHGPINIRFLIFVCLSDCPSTWTTLLPAAKCGVEVSQSDVLKDGSSLGCGTVSPSAAGSQWSASWRTVIYVFKNRPNCKEDLIFSIRTGVLLWTWQTIQGHHTEQCDVDTAVDTCHCSVCLHYTVCSGHCFWLCLSVWLLCCIKPAHRDLGTLPVCETLLQKWRCKNSKHFGGTNKM